MIKMIGYEKYILARIKQNNFLAIWNSNDIIENKKIKEIFDFKQLYENKYVFNKYKKILYDELINNLFDLVKLEFQTVYEFIYKKEEKDLNKLYNNLPNEIKNVLNKNFSNNIIDLFNISEESKNGPIMYYLDDLSIELLDILEMLFEREKYIESRKKYLEREESKEEKELLEYLKNNIIK